MSAQSFFKLSQSEIISMDKSPAVQSTFSAIPPIKDPIIPPIKAKINPRFFETISLLKPMSNEHTC